MNRTRVSLTVLLFTAAAASPVLAQVAPDPGAPESLRPSIRADAQGRALVDIQSPSQAGLSHNVYQRFDVPAEGVVLNNSASNPLLASGVHATTILNEVNSANPSHLNGALSVLGPGADVIIANPSGIMVDGGSFINATRATLTTGTPQVSNGALTGFNFASDAVITIGPGGLDARGPRSTDILSRALTVGGPLKARKLAITTGMRLAKPGAERSAQPEGVGHVAIDTRALGSMYANTMVIRATEEGMDIHNAGTWRADAGSIVVSSRGALRNTGTIAARDDARLAAKGAIENAGTLQGGAATVVHGRGDVRMAGRIASVAAEGAMHIEPDGVLKATSSTAGANPPKPRQIHIEANGVLELLPGVSISADHDVWLRGGAGLTASDARVTSAHGRAIGYGATGLGLVNTTVTGRQVHLESGVRSQERLAAAPASLLIEGGYVRGESRTTLMASKDLYIASPEGVCVETGGNLDISAARDVNIGPGMSLVAHGDMRVTAGAQLTLAGRPADAANPSRTVMLTASGNMALQGKSMHSHGARLNAGQDLEIGAFGGHATLHGLPDVADAGIRASSVSVHGSAVDIQAMNVRSERDLSIIADTGRFTATDALLDAQGTLDIASADAQTHANGAYHGGLVSIHNMAGHLALQRTHVESAPTGFPPLDLLGGSTRIESGGTLSLDADTLVAGTRDLSVIQGMGDIVINPADAPRGTFTPAQLRTEGTLTVAARNGDLLLNASPDGAGQPQSTRVVSIEGKGEIQLEGRNVTLQGSMLRTDGALTISATGGDLNLPPLQRAEASGGLTNTDWDGADLRGRGDVTLRAAGNIHAGSLNASSSEQLAMLAGGSVIATSNAVQHLKDDRHAGGWFVDERFPTKTMLHGEAGIHIEATGGQLQLTNADVRARNGSVRLEAMEGIDLFAGQERKMHEIALSGGNSRHLLAAREGFTPAYELHSETLRNEPVTVTAQNIELRTGGIINSYATRFHAERDFSIDAGDSVRYYAVFDQDGKPAGSKASPTPELLRNLSLRPGGAAITHIESFLPPKPAKLQTLHDTLGEPTGDQGLLGTVIRFSGKALLQAEFPNARREMGWPIGWRQPPDPDGID